MVTPDVKPVAPTSRAGRNLPLAIGTGVGMCALVLLSLFVRKEGFLVVATVAVVQRWF